MQELGLRDRAHGALSLPQLTGLEAEAGAVCPGPTRPQGGTEARGFSSG